ncbi:MAG TPA: hypothetical protein VIQ99_04395 [Gammaproteobacteria bacterium]
MNKVHATVLGLGLVGALGAFGQSAPPPRQMNVTQGPESVFTRPVAEIMPALAGATATAENGRVGSELVFWGYRQADGRPVFFFACAPKPEFDCADRVRAVCPAASTVLANGHESGTVVRRECRSVSVVAPGDVRPGCEDRVESVPMAVGLVSCG